MIVEAEGTKVRVGRGTVSSQQPTVSPERLCGGHCADPDLDWRLNAHQTIVALKSCAPLIRR